MRPRTSLLLCALFMTFTAASASAQPTPPPEALVREAEQRFNEGKELLRQKRWAEARVKFLQACAVQRTVNCPKNLGAVEFELGMYPEATAHFGEYLRQRDLPKNELASVRSFYESAFAKSGHLEIAAPDGATVSVDGAEIGKAPLADLVHVKPGSHDVRAVLTDGRTTSASASADTGKTVKVSLVPEARVGAPAAPPLPPAATATSAPPAVASGGPRSGEEASPGESRWSSGKIATVVSLSALSVGAFATSVGFFVGAGARADDVQRLQGTTGSCLGSAGTTASCRDLAAADDARASDRNAAWVFLGVGTLLGVATATVAVLWPSEPLRRERSFVVVPMAPGATGLGLAAAGHF